MLAGRGLLRKGVSRMLTALSLEGLAGCVNQQVEAMPGQV